MGCVSAASRAEERYTQCIGHSRLAAPVARNASSALLLLTMTSDVGRVAREGRPLGGSVTCTEEPGAGTGQTALSAANTAKEAREAPRGRQRSESGAAAAARRADSACAAAEVLARRCALPAHATACVDTAMPYEVHTRPQAGRGWAKCLLRLFIIYTYTQRYHRPCSSRLSMLHRASCIALLGDEH